MTAPGVARRELLRAFGVTVAGTTVTRTASAAADAAGPTVYVADWSGALNAVDATTGENRWTFDTRGPVQSSPTVVDGTIYVGSIGTFEGEQDVAEPAGDAAVYAIDAATGEKEWQFDAPSRPVISSPTVVDDTVYATSDDWKLYAIDAATGDREWAFETGVLERYVSPTVVDGTAYVGSKHGTLHAVDAATGEAEWEVSESLAPVTSPTVYDDTLYVGSDDAALFAVDAATGDREWAFDESSEHAASSPTITDGTVYVGGSGGTLFAVDAATGERRWGFDAGERVASSPTVAGETVYVGAGSPFGDGPAALYAVDAATGEREWAFEEPSDWVVSSPTVTDEMVYVGGQDGALYAVDAATGERRWAFESSGAPIWSSPTVVDDPTGGDSVGSRVRLGTLGHHHEWATQSRDADQSNDDGLPGPGVVGAAASLGAAGYLGKRRRGPDRTDEN